MILQTKQNGVCVLTIDGGKGNLLDLADIEALAGFVAGAAQDPDATALVLTGLGNSFCTGLKAVAEKSLQSPQEAAILFARLDELLLSLFGFPKPFVAAVNGHSLGGGLLIQLCADHVLLVQSEKIKLGFPELKIGATLDHLMMDVARYSLSKPRDLDALLYSGELVTAEQAGPLGLATALVPAADLATASLTRAAELSQLNPQAFAITKLALRKQTLRNMEEALATQCHQVFASLLF